ncbi:MAG: hypothetical protein WBE80_15660 [Methylocella sp.]
MTQLQDLKLGPATSVLEKLAQKVRITDAELASLHTHVDQLEQSDQDTHHEHQHTQDHDENCT